MSQIHSSNQRIATGAAAFGLLLLAMAASAYAQDLGAVLGTSAADAYAASTHGPVVTNVQIFSRLYDGLLNPIEAAMDAATGQLVAYVAPVLKLAVVLFLMVTFLGYVFGGSVGDFLLARVVRDGIRPAIVIQVLASTQSINQWVVTPLRTLPTEIGNALAGIGEAPLTGGAPFDGLFASLVYIKDTAYQHTSGVIDAIGQSVLIAVAFIFGLIFTAVTFVVWLFVHAVLDATLILSPLFVALAIFPATRGFLSGYLNTVATLVVGLIFCVVLLKVSLTIQQQLLAPILAAPADAGVAGMTTALCEMVACEFVVMVLVVMSQGLAGSICGSGVQMFGSVSSVSGGVYKGGQLIGRLAKKAVA